MIDDGPALGTIPRGTGAAAHQGDGFVATDDDVVRQPQFDIAGLRHTPEFFQPGAVVTHGDPDGILVQDVAGLHSGVNPISGDFSTGASGLLISNGQLGGPIREFTIASTLQRMLQDVVEIGGDVDWLPMRAAGVSLVIRDVTMSGA